MKWITNKDWKTAMIHVALLSLVVCSSLVLSARKDAWRDEAFSWLASQSIESTMRFAAHDTVSPMYHWLLWGWRQLAGEGLVELRLLSLLAVVMMQAMLLELAFLWHAELTKERKGNRGLSFKWAWYGLIVLNTAVLYMSAELRSYGLLQLMVVAQVVGLERFLRNQRAQWWLMWVLAASMGIWLHTLSAVVSGAILLAGVLVAAEKSKKVVMGLVLGVCVVGLSYVPWIEQAQQQLKLVQDEFWYETTFRSARESTRGLWSVAENMKFDKTYQDWLSWTSFFLIVGGGLSALLIKRKMKDLTFQWVGEERVMVLGGLSLVLGLFAYASLTLVGVDVLNQRYVSIMSGLWILLALWLTWKIYRIQNILMWILVGGYLLMQVLVGWQLLRSEVKTAYAQLEILNTPVYTAEALDVLPCRVYAKSCVFVGELDVTPYYVGARQLEQQVVEHASWWDVEGERVWVLTRGERRGYGQPSLAGLTWRMYHAIQEIDLGDGVKLVEYYQLFSE